MHEYVKDLRIYASFGAKVSTHFILILRGHAGLDDQAAPDMREAGWKHLERLGEHYEGADDPTLVFFSVEEPEAFVCNHDEWVPVEL